MKSTKIIVSAGDAITAKLVQEAGFDGIWVSGFEVSARLGLSDNGSITMTEMLQATKPIIDAVKIPVIVDVDNGYGGVHNFIRCAKEFERIGTYAICIEDNPFPKTNSLFGGKTSLLSMEEHGKKIRAAKKSTKNIKIIARTEALVRGYGLQEAIKRIDHYIECGADIVLIHSRDTSGKEANLIPTKRWKIPVMIIPTKFPNKTNKELKSLGFSYIVWANHTERIKIKAIRQGLKILKDEDCAKSIEDNLGATLDDLRNLTPIKEDDKLERLLNE
jgi:phosphoenolpyruvate phosphomutase